MLVGNLAKLPRGDVLRRGNGRVEQSPEHAGLEHAVLVEEEHEGRRSARHVGVVSLAESEIGAGVLHVHAREGAARLQLVHRDERYRGLCVGAVVLDEEVADGVARGFRETLEKLLEERGVGLVRDDADVNCAH